MRFSRLCIISMEISYIKIVGEGTEADLNCKTELIRAGENRPYLYSLYHALFESSCRISSDKEKEINATRFIQRIFQDELQDASKENYSISNFLNSQISELHSDIDNSFLRADVKSLINDSIQAVDKAVNNLCHAVSTSQLSWAELSSFISKYLDSYFLTLYYTLSYWEELKQSLSYRDFICNVLNLGCTFKGFQNDKVSGKMTPFAPNYVAAIWELARLVLKYQPTASDNLFDSDETNKEILFLNLCRYMRWFIVSPDGTLCHVGLRSYIEGESEDINGDGLCLPIRDLQSYSSFEGINELRLFEKIQYELENRKSHKHKNDSTFVVSIIGDLSRRQIERLGQMLLGWLEDKKTTIKWCEIHSLKICFQLITRNNLVGDPVNLGGKIIEDEQYLESDSPLENPIVLSKLLGQADLLFLLDCTSLYEKFSCDSYPELNSFLQGLSGESYQSMDAFLEKSDATLSINNKYYDMRNLLTGAAYFDREPCLMNKKVHGTLIHFLEQYIQDNVDFSPTIYLYFSDLSAAQDIYWMEDKLIRIERHSGKEFSILRLGNFTENNLPIEPRDNKIIVFNLWQFIKHISLGCAADLVKGFGFEKGEVQYHLLSEVLIGIDYENWPESLKISYYFSRRDDFPEKFEDSLVRYIEKVIMPCFQPKIEDIYQQYMRRCISSFLYSDARHVDDMFFLHLFSIKFDHIKKVQWAFLRLNTELPKIFSQRSLKYSNKRFYQELFTDYDTPRLPFTNQFIKLQKIKTSKVSKSYVNYFKVIASVCERNHYRDSDLYRNSETMQQNS